MGQAIEQRGEQLHLIDRISEAKHDPQQHLLFRSRSGGYDWWSDDELAVLQGEPSRYWKIENDELVAMTDAEKAAVDLAIAKTAKHASNAAARQTTIDEGIEVNGITLAADEGSRDALHGYLTLQEKAVSLGVIAAGSTFQVHDQSGTPHDVTLATFTTMLLAYGQAQQQIVAGHNARAIAIDAATTQAELDAVTIPGD